MISVIIPVYNAEPYLPHCLDSVLGSTYSDFELLLINDGSTDRSLEICTEYARRDSRVRLFSQENQGVSAARNRGLEECAGEWIVFVDADDVISPDFLSLVAAEDDTAQDMLLFDFAETEQKLTRVGEYIPAYEKIFYSKDEMLCLFREMLCFGQLAENGNVNLASSNGRAFKKSIIDQCGIRFSPKLTYGEDTVFNIEYQLKAKSCSYIPAPVYFYNVHADSSSYGLDCWGHVLGRMEKIEGMKSALEKGGIFRLLRQEYYAYALDLLAFSLVRVIFSPFNMKSYNEKCAVCLKLWKFELCSEAAQYFYSCGTLRRRIILFAFHHRWYCVLSLISRYCHMRLKWENPDEIEKMWGGTWHS